MTIIYYAQYNQFYDCSWIEFASLDKIKVQAFIDKQKYKYNAREGNYELKEIELDKE